MLKGWANIGASLNERRPSRLTAPRGGAVRLAMGDVVFGRATRCAAGPAVARAGCRNPGTNGSGGVLKCVRLVGHTQPFVPPEAVDALVAAGRKRRQAAVVLASPIRPKRGCFGLKANLVSRIGLWQPEHPADSLNLRAAKGR